MRRCGRLPSGCLLSSAKGPPKVYGLAQIPGVGTWVVDSRQLHARERDRPWWQVSSGHMRSRYRARLQWERHQKESSRCVRLASHTTVIVGMAYLDEHQRTYKARDVKVSKSLAENAGH